MILTPVHSPSLFPVLLLPVLLCYENNTRRAEIFPEVEITHRFWRKLSRHHSAYGSPLGPLGVREPARVGLFTSYRRRNLSIRHSFIVSTDSRAGETVRFVMRARRSDRSDRTDYLIR